MKVVLDHWQQLAAAMRAAGLEPPPPSVIAAWKGRFGRKGSGYFDLYRVNGSRVCGRFGDHRLGIHRTFRSDSARPLTDKERDEIDAAERQREHDDARERDDAAKFAQSIWQSSKAAKDSHPYLKAKSVKAYGIRQRRDTLVLAAYNKRGVIQSIQEIHPDGMKRFLAGSSVKGCWFPLGPAHSPVLLVAEGYATAASLHQATGYAVAVAFHAGNLAPVAQSLRELYPDRDLVICGDDDV